MAAEQGQAQHQHQVAATKLTPQQNNHHHHHHHAPLKVVRRESLPLERRGSLPASDSFSREQVRNCWVREADVGSGHQDHMCPEGACSNAQDSSRAAGYADVLATVTLAHQRQGQMRQTPLEKPLVTLECWQCDNPDHFMMEYKCTGSFKSSFTFPHFLEMHWL